jgi:hypothetical protein
MNSQHRNLVRASSIAALFAVALSAAWAQHGDMQHGDMHALPGKPPEALGKVNFSVQCDGAAQKEFNHAMALFHSFWFDPAKQSFMEVLREDPKCGMAYWGIALMSLANPFAWPASPAAMKAGATAAADAQGVGARTQRERDYIGALQPLFANWETTEHRSRVVAFEKAMGDVAAKYPEDDEAKILHALLLDATALAADKTYAHQLKAAAILEPLLGKYPDHPGVAHYLIHTYDYTELAGKGLPAARLYATIAPSVPHALHMPSHIFARVGNWKEMVEGNRASYLAARSELSEKTLGVGSYDALHAMDYLVFGELQQARDKAAKGVVNEIARIRTVNVENFVAAYALAAIPARYAVERNDWKAAAALQLSPPNLAWQKFPQAEAVLVSVRGLAAARTGAIPAARKDLARLASLKEAMTTAKIGYWPEQTDFQMKAIEAWIALEEKQPERALQLMRISADAEAASDKHPVTPGGIVPMRELLAEMLLRLDQPAPALAEFERSLAREPNRFRSVYGAALAAEAANNSEAAKKYYSKLRSLTAGADTTRQEVKRANAFLAANG